MPTSERWAAGFAEEFVKKGSYCGFVIPRTVHKLVDLRTEAHMCHTKFISLYTKFISLNTKFISIYTKFIQVHTKFMTWK